MSKNIRRRDWSAAFLFLPLAFASGVKAQVSSRADRPYGRSMVITRGGIAATSQFLASQAGAQTLARGGSAVDAAIAANAVLQVTEPMMNGMGGDLFAIEWDAKTGKLTGLNASGWAPKGLTIDYLHGKGFQEMPMQGIDAVTVPGCVEGWAKLHDKFGKLPWKDLFAPAIHYAEAGYPVTEMIQSVWANGDLSKLTSSAEARRIFLHDGKAPEVGEIMRNPDLAHALRLVAERGADAFYRGPIAQAILKTEEKERGPMTAEDLSAFSAEWVEPISTEYRGWKVYELPPNGQGIAALMILNLLEQFSPAPEGALSAEELHRRIEATKVAYADLYRYVADPRFAKVPIEGMLSKKYAADRAALMDANHANCSRGPGAPPGSDTTYLTAVDRDGNIVSMIQSLYAGWGSGVVIEGMGFHLQNRGALFRLDPQHPDALAPRKRPFHTIIPAFMEKGDLHIGFGIMGGATQPLAHAQFVSNFVDYGMNIQGALDAARYTGISPDSCRVTIESRVKPDVLDALRKMGHELDVRQEYSIFMGRGQAVIHDSKTGVNYGASDPRADGSAEPEPLPQKQ